MDLKLFKMTQYADEAMEAENKYHESLYFIYDEEEWKEDIKKIKEEKKFIEGLETMYKGIRVGDPITSTDQVTMSLLSNRKQDKIYFLDEYNGDLAWLTTKEMMEVFRDIAKTHTPRNFDSLEELLDGAKGLSDFKIVERLIANYSNPFLRDIDPNYGVPEAYRILQNIIKVNPERHTNLNRFQISQSYKMYVEEEA